ncbi:MAG: hypothetical protein ACYDG2_03415 [Ruminiclostridium sp.]
MKKNAKILIICCCFIVVCALVLVLLSNIKVGSGDSKASSSTILKEDNTGIIEETEIYESDQKEFKVESTN